MPIPPGRKNSCFSRSTLQCLRLRRAFADVQLRGTLIPEVSACKICHDGKLHMATHTHTHTHTQICTHTCTHTYTHTCRHARIHTHTQTHYTHTHKHMFTPTHKHIYTSHMPGVGNFTKGDGVFFPPQSLLLDLFIAASVNF